MDGCVLGCMIDDIRIDDISRIDLYMLMGMCCLYVYACDVQKCYLQV